MTRLKLGSNRKEYTYIMEGGRGKQSSSLTSRVKQEEKNFLENGSMLLKELLSFCNGKCTPIPIRSFSVKEIILATNNFDPRLVINYVGGYKLYKGCFGNNLVSVKKFGSHSWSLESSIHDIVMASQMSKHKNVLKLLGCCLEFEIPVAVYEYAGSLCLSHCLSGTVVEQELLWGMRLRIANQIANAIVYLHTALPKSVIHRDLKPTGIIIDQLGVAKLIDFSMSISIPDGETQVEDEVTGTVGFIDPEYFHSSNFTTKSDVYGFGIILLIILTGQKAIDQHRGEDGVVIAAYVLKYVGMDRFNEIVDPRILGDGAGTEKEQQLKDVLALSLRCIQLVGENRPDMIDVAKELRRIERSVHV